MLTASNFPSALGRNQYCSANVLFRRATGQSKEQRPNYIMQHGTDNESIAREKYEKFTGETVIEFGCVRHSEVHLLGHDCLGGSPDGITRDSGKLIEIKCPFSRKITNEVPIQYMDQIQGLMWTFDLDSCDFVQFKPENTREDEIFLITPVKRDPEWSIINVPLLLEFYNKVDAYKNDRAKKDIECRKGVAQVISNAIRAHFAETDSPEKLSYTKEHKKVLDLHLDRMQSQRGNNKPRKKKKKQKTDSDICFIDSDND